MGTDCALVGAYVLASEIHRDFVGAFDRYEQNVRPFIDKAQDLPPGAPGILNPQSAWGVCVLRWILWLVWKSRIVPFIQTIPSLPAARESYTLDDYGWNT